MKGNLNSNTFINFVAQQLLLNTDSDDKIMAGDFKTPPIYVDINSNKEAIASNITVGNNPNKPGWSNFFCRTFFESQDFQKICMDFWYGASEQNEETRSLEYLQMTFVNLRRGGRKS